MNDDAGTSTVHPCLMCGYNYDEALGDPIGGVPAGTKWNQVPPEWACPECGAGKGEFAEF